MIKKLALCALLLPNLAFSASDNAEAVEKSKLSEDPTKVTTKLGLNYNNSYDLDNANTSLQGSLAFDPARKINVSINSDASEWRLGGSWLFDLGIVNFNFGRREFVTGATQNNYSIGTFIPLSFFDIAPWGIQIFPMAGYSYIDGESLCAKSFTDCPDDAELSVDPGFVLVSNESQSGYLGVFALKPITEEFTAIMLSGGSIGSNDYSGYWVGGGLGYTLMKKHSVKALTYHLDNSYGEETNFILAYSYQF